ncbi:hypothetical protein D1BOALGB6SA_3491, partial [Olavius sp. associated proteobacterium Delta 1]
MRLLLQKEFCISSRFKFYTEITLPDTIIEPLQPCTQNNLARCTPRRSSSKATDAVLGDVVYKLYKAMYEISQCVQVLWVECICRE